MGKGKLIEAFKLAGDQHKYQTRIYYLFIFVWIFFLITIMSPAFLFMEPTFQCKGENKNLQFSEKQACPIIQQCQVVDDFSLAAQKGLYCEDKWWRVAFQTALQLGTFTGTFLVNIISDTKGRKNAFLISNCLVIFGTLLLIFGSWYQVKIMMFLGQYLRGVGVQPLISLVYTYLAQFFSDQYRQKTISMIYSCGGITFFLMGTFYLMEFNWLYFLIFIQLIPGCIVIYLSQYYLLQSPYFEMSRKNIDKVRQILTQIAIYNDKSDNLPEINKIIDQQAKVNQNSQEKDKPSVQNVFKILILPQYLKKILLVAIVIGSIHFNQLGMSFEIYQLGFGFFVNSFVMGTVQLLSFYISKSAVQNMSRKNGIMMFFGLMIVFQLLSSGSIIGSSALAITFFIGFIRISTICSNVLIDCILTESFTTQIQSSAIGVVEGLGISLSFIAPSVLMLSKSIGISGISGLSFFLFIGVIAAFFIPQTQKQKQETTQLQSKLIQDIELKRISVTQDSKQETQLAFTTKK